MTNKTSTAGNATPKTILNLGCGKARIKGAVNVDLLQTRYADEVVNLMEFPWPWTDQSVDEIYMINFIEHVPDTIVIFRECHRILKPGGLLHIQPPQQNLWVNSGSGSRPRL